MPDPYESPEDETPGQRRARLMNLNNPGWKPEVVDKVDEVPPPESEVKPEPKPAAEPPVAESKPVTPARQPAKER